MHPVTANRRPSALCTPPPVTLAREQQTTDLDYNMMTPSVVFARLSLNWGYRQTTDVRIALPPDVATLCGRCRRHV